MAITVGVIAIMAGVFQINPIWNSGVQPAHISAGSQPTGTCCHEGMLRIFPPWEINIRAYLPDTAGVLGQPAVPAADPRVAAIYPDDRAESWTTPSTTCCSGPGRAGPHLAGCNGHHVLCLAGGAGSNDIIADKFNISLNATTWAAGSGILLLRRWPTS